eukprot:767579-Hanusia_phi.AAC.7
MRRFLQLRDKIVVVRQRCHECHMTGSGVPGKTDIMLEVRGLKDSGEASGEDQSEVDEDHVEDETFQTADGMQEAGGGHCFQWEDGSMHMVPPGFVFPTKETVRGMMSLWYCGNSMRMLDLDGEVRTVRPSKHLCSARFI